MERNYTNIKAVEKEIFEMREAGKTRQEFLIDEYIHFYNHERIQLKTKLTPPEKRCQLA